MVNLLYHWEWGPIGKFIKRPKLKPKGETNSSSERTCHAHDIHYINTISVVAFFHFGNC
jgi:hypothetical protein